MPNYTATTTITIGRGEKISASTSGNYDEVFNIRQVVDNTTGFITLISASTTKASATLEDCKSVIIKNDSPVGAEIQLHSQEWTDATPDTNAGVESYQLLLLRAGEFVYLPNFRQVNFQAVDTSGGDAYQLTNQVPDANMYVASGALTTEGFADDNDTTITFDDGSGGAAGHMFKANDLIRLDNEICKVVSLTSTIFTVERGVHGSTKADHTNNTAIRFPFFNANSNYNKYSTAQTDSSGSFRAMNLFGYGRSLIDGADGIVPSSFSGKFYSAGYQEIGLSGITSSSKTGLTASTAYAFDIAVDGGSDHTLSITTDAANGTFGGSAGLVRKLQDALDVQYYTTGSNLLNLKVFVGIVGGDLRFTSGQHLSTSAISITAPASGTTPFEVGVFTMAVTAIENAVPARLPNDTFIDKKSGVVVPNTGAFFYDDGHSNIKGACNGSINYETGEIILTGAPPNANFVFDANYGSAHAGGNDFGDGTANCIRSISARSCNSKINSTIEIIGLK